MKYRTKLYIAAFSISIVSSSLALIIVEGLTRRYLFKFLKINVASIAGTTASMLNGDLVREIRTPEDINKPAFRALQSQLRKARNINRGPDIYIKYLYTSYPDPKDPKKFLFGIDPEESPKNFSPPGSEDPATTKRLSHELLGDTFSTSEPTTDPWGTWFTGYSPIYDSEGKYVGTVGADISAALVKKNLNHLLFFAAIAFLFSLIETAVVVTIHAKNVTRALNLLEESTRQVRKGHYKFRIHLSSHDEFQDLAEMVNNLNEWLEENEKIKRGFTHYISQKALERLILQYGNAKLVGHRRKMTVLYSRIHNLTAFTQNFSPEEVVQFLNEYFKIVLEIIFNFNGMLDKLLGDGIIAEFGMPIEDIIQEKNAILAAIEIQKALEPLRKEWEKKSSQKLFFGIGIHTGETIVGTIDSENRMQYTSIGDTVDIASQLERGAREEEHAIIISESTFKAIEKDFSTQKLREIQLADSGQKIQTYAILSAKPVQQ